MDAKEALRQVVDGMTDDEARQLLILARLVADQADREEWGRLSMNGLAKAYADEEAEYSLSDLRPQPSP
jgi:hypothetical protein